jgi:hypothetical protein
VLSGHLIPLPLLLPADACPEFEEYSSIHGHWTQQRENSRARSGLCLVRIDGSGHCHRSSLDLDTFDAISTLESLRAFIPELGSRIKTFAASSSNRYRDPNSFRLARTHARTHTPTRISPTRTRMRARTLTHARAQARSLTHPLSGASMAPAALMK